MDKNEEKALALLESRASDARISCTKALEIARETGVSSRRIGAIIDENGIKIVQCQLGCFGWKQEEPA